jgi:ubiquinone/menaquinone biosynthesis C-methylase UbiE
MKTSYDVIGRNYDNTRQADPYLTQWLFEELDLPKGAHVLDVGCGTGNYTIALSGKGLHFTGIDPSERMLEEARKKSDQVQWMIGVAEDLPFAQGIFDGAIATLTTHHWKDLDAGFRAIRRVLRRGAPLVIFTSTPDQMRNYWLSHYFPHMMERSAAVMPGLARTRSALQHAGFSRIISKPYTVREDLRDLFLYAAKYAPERYLDPIYRQGISSFTSLAEDEEIANGLQQLAQDIEKGKWQQVARSFDDRIGDYLMINAR